MLNKLETLLKSAKGLLNQQFQSVGSDGLCRYNGPNGAHCGVGFLILPEHYSKDLEDKSPFHTSVSNALVKSGVDINEDSMLSMLEDIQGIHDDHTADEWKDLLTNLAQKVLNPEELATFLSEIKDL